MRFILSHSIFLLIFIFSPNFSHSQTLDWDFINFSETKLVEGKVNGFNMGGYSYGRMGIQSENITVPQECNQCASASIFCNQIANDVTGPAFSSLETKENIISQTKKLQPSVLRFPGGTHSGWYHLYTYGNDGLYDASVPVIDKGYGMSLIETAHLNNPLSYCILDSRLTVDENYIDGFINYINATAENNEPPKIEVSYVVNLLTHFRFPSTQTFCTGCGRTKALVPMNGYDCEQKFTYSYVGNESLFDNNPDIYRFELYYKETQDAIERIITNLNLTLEDVFYVEMGNEYYGSLTYPVSKYQMTVDNYAKLVEEYSERLKCYFSNKVNIKTGVVTNPNTPWQNGLIDLMDEDQNASGESLNESLDAVIYHHYYHRNDCLDEANISDRFNCAKDAFRNHIEDDLVNGLDNLDSSFPNLDVWITEWNILGGDANKNNSYLNTILHASFVQEYALSLLEYNLDHDNKVTMATHHRLGDHNAWSVIQTEEGDNNAAYYRAGAHAMQDIGKLYEYDNMQYVGNILTDGSSEFNSGEATTKVFYQNKDTENDKSRFLIYYTNKTTDDIPMDLPDEIDGMLIQESSISYVNGEHIFSYGPSNKTAGKNRYKTNSEELNNESLNMLGYGDIHNQLISVKDSLLEYSQLTFLPSNSVGVVEVTFNSVVDNVDEKRSGNFSFEVSPNPTESNFTIEIYNANNRHVNIKIIDMQGEIIKQLSSQLISAKNKLLVDVTSFPIGIYLVTIIDELGNMNTKKLLVH